MRTRWLCSGYGFVVVGADGDPYYTRQIQANFHHHYFRMGLIAHFHRASILILRDALADAIKLPAGDKRRAAITDVQGRMVEFRSRYWFREVSTQLQGQEIFRWWSDRLDNQELFEQVSDDIDAAASLVRTEDAERLTRLAPGHHGSRARHYVHRAGSRRTGPGVPACWGYRGRMERPGRGECR